MKSSSRNSIVAEPSAGPHLSWTSIMITASPRSPHFVTTPSNPSSSYSRSPVSDLQNNMARVRFAADLAHEGTSSSLSEAEVPLNKTAKSYNASSLSTGSDFEFDSCCLSEINGDPPVSPKLICRSATAYNYCGGLHNNGRLELIMQQSNPAAPSSPHTPVTRESHQPSAPSSRSAGAWQLVAEKLTGDHKGNYDFDYKSPSSAPQTPNLLQKRDGQLVKQLLRQDNSSLRGFNINDQARSKSAALNRQALLKLSPLMMQKKVYLAAGLENNYHLLSSSSSSGSFAVHPPVDINEQIDQHKFASMDQAAKSEIIKKHSGDSNKKRAFKDFLRRTVPSSKSDQCKDTNPNVESPRQSTSSLVSSPKTFYLLSGLRKSARMSPAASPPRGSRAAAAMKHGPTPPGYPSPMRSPPRPPMSPHALHYRQKKARAEELKRKTFLPYRQSVLGCFGGALSATRSHSKALQQVW